MAVDPYSKSGGVIPRKTGGITRNISGLADAIKKVVAGSTSGLGNSGGGSGYSGGGGAVAAAPSPLDSLPKTPEIQALINKGLLRADMAPEQILAIVGLSAQVTGVPIDIAALKAQLAQDYQTTTGGILGMGADWMQQMFGANMPDGNAAAYAADPMFAQYAAGLGQQQATAGLNQATDQAWFDKQQQAMTDYYNGLMQSIAMGGGVAAGGSGGGGGGGGRRHGGGGGGGSGSGSGDWGFTDPVTTSTQTEQVQAKSSERESQMWPEYKNEVYDAAVAQFGVDDPRTQYVLDTLDTTTGPDPALEQVAHDMTAAQATIANRNALDENNKTWTTAAPASFEALRGQYQNLTGNILGDTNPEDAFQWQTVGDQSGVNLANIAPGSIGDKIVQLMSQAYDPANPNAMPVNPVTGAPQVGTNEGFDQAAEFFNRILNASQENKNAMMGSSMAELVQLAQNRSKPGNTKGSAPGAVGPTYTPSAGVAGGGMSTTQANPYATGMPGAYSPLSSANSGSISGGPATSVLSPESVMAGTYGVALNQTDQAANVSPYDSSLGDPLRRLNAELAAQTGGPVQPTVPSSPPPNPPMGGFGNPPEYPPGEEWKAYLNQSTPQPNAEANIQALMQPLYDKIRGTTSGPVNGSNFTAPDGNYWHNGAWFDAQDRLVGYSPDANTPPGAQYGPSGNTRPMLGQDALLGMPANYGKDGSYGKGDSGIQQAAMSKLAAPDNTNPAVARLAQISELWNQIQDASSEGPITGNTVYDQIIGNVALTPQTTDQYGRQVPSKLRPDLLETMQQLSAKQKMEDSRGIDPTLFHPDPGTYYEGIPAELSGEALTDAQMVNMLAPGLRDMIRNHSTLWDMNPYSRHVDNTGTSTQQLQTKQKSKNPDVANAVAAGDLNDLATVPDLITQPYDEVGQPIYSDELYQGAPPGGIVDVNLGGGGGLGGLKSMAIRRITQPTPKAPVSTGKSHIKPGGQKTYSKGAGTKKSYITTGKTIGYTPKQKKKYSK